MNKKVYDGIIKIINEIMEKESPELSRKRSATLDKAASFMESLEVDSLLALEMVSRIEKKFGVQLKEEDFAYFDSMENITELIEKKIEEKENPPSINKRKNKKEEKASPRTKRPKVAKKPKKVPPKKSPR